MVYQEICFFSVGQSASVPWGLYVFNHCWATVMARLSELLLIVWNLECLGNVSVSEIKHLIWIQKVWKMKRLGIVSVLRVKRPVYLVSVAWLNVSWTSLQTATTVLYYVLLQSANIPSDVIITTINIKSSSSIRGLNGRGR